MSEKETNDGHKRYFQLRCQLANVKRQAIKVELCMVLIDEAMNFADSLKWSMDCMLYEGCIYTDV